jgi:hypothetical protein
MLGMGIGARSRSLLGLEDDYGGAVLAVTGLPPPTSGSSTATASVRTLRTGRRTTWTGRSTSRTRRSPGATSWATTRGLDSIGTTFVSFLAETTATDKDNTYLAKVSPAP